MRSVPFEFGEVWLPGASNPSVTITFRDKKGKHTIISGAGTSDNTEVFRQGAITYILTVNRRHDYVGLAAYEGETEMGDVFLQNNYEINEALGPKGLDYADVTMAKRLANYIM